MPAGKAKIISRLRAQQVTSARELLQAIRSARERIAGKVVAAAAQKNIALSATPRENLYKQVGGYYGNLAREIDVWAKGMTRKVALNWHEQANADIRAGSDPAGVVRFDPTRVKTYWQTIHPDNSQHLAGVFTQKMGAEDIRSLRQAFVETFRQSSLEGWTHREINKKLQQRWNEIAGEVANDRFVDNAGRTWDNARYMQMLVRTTTARVARESYIDTVLAHGDDLMRVVNVGESCKICEAWDGLIISVSGTNKDYPSYQNVLDAGVFHPNCLIPGQNVVCPDVRGAYKANYSGKIFRIVTALGQEATVTPNHMFLTPNGFVPAHLLTTGNDIICCNPAKWHSLVGPNINHGPSLIEEIFMALSRSPGMAARSVPTAPEYLHGDMMGGDGNIEIISTDSFLVNNAQVGLAKPLSKADFIPVHPELLPFASERPLAAFLLATGYATNRVVCKTRNPLAILRRGLTEKNLVLFRNRTDMQVGFTENSVNGQAATAKSLREVVDAFPELVTTDHIARIDVLEYSGHVYDLLCKSTLYLAGGLVSSNCDCMLERVDETLDKEDIERQAN